MIGVQYGKKCQDEYYYDENLYFIEKQVLLSVIGAHRVTVIVLCRKIAE